MTPPIEREKQMSTEDTTTVASAEQTTEHAPRDAAPEETSDETTSDESEGNDREAARYRRRLRETESERDALTARVEQYQRAEAERIAAESLAAPADLWLFTDVAAVLNDEGDVDPEKVREIGRTVAAERPGLARVAPSFDGGARTSVDPGKSWSQLIGGKS